jgi:hypothetical protein
VFSPILGFHFFKKPVMTCIDITGIIIVYRPINSVITILVQVQS